RTCSAVQVVYGTDDTTAIINAFTYAATAGAVTTLYFPAGMYLGTPSHLGVNAMNIPSHVRVTGDGWNTIIRSTGAEDAATLSRELWGVNTGTAGTADPETNATDIVIEGIHF